jgi:hypothetical protein
MRRSGPRQGGEWDKPIPEGERMKRDRPSAAPQDQPKSSQPRDTASWAVSTNVLHVSQVPAEAVNLNVDGRRVAGALQGFGQLWQKPTRCV